MRNPKRRGIALLTAIWMLAVLVVLVAGFAAMVHSETQVARNFGGLTQARWLAQTGLRRAEVALGQVVAEPFTALDEGRLELTPEDDAETDAYRAVVEDEAGKINLNTAEPETLSALFPLEVVDAIIDWRDEDSTPEPEGAEEEYYAGLTPPYHARDGAFKTVREVLLVKGVTPAMLAEKVTEDGRTVEDLLTVVSEDTNTDAQGEPRINIATATKATLTEAFNGTLTEQEIDAIIAQREAPFSSPAQIVRTPNLSRAKVAQIYDRLTTTADETRPGLVNINTAPAEVLAALPGMDEATAQAIVQHRTTQGPFEDVGKLLDVEAVSTTTFERAAAGLTTRSRLFRIVSRGREVGGVTATLTCLVRANPEGETPLIRVLYWRE